MFTLKPIRIENNQESCPAKSIQFDSMRIALKRVENTTIPGQLKPLKGESLFVDFFAIWMPGTHTLDLHPLIKGGPQKIGILGIWLANCSVLNVCHTERIIII